MLRLVGDGGAFERRQPTPWARPTGLDAVIEDWRSRDAIARNLALDETLPAREARFAPVPGALHPSVRGALERRGLTRLYAHQARAFELAAAGQDVVVATPTASGKSLAYNLPVLDTLARAPDARALYLFPTKALSRDQEASLRAFLAEAGLPHGAVTYDGDTAGDARRVARERSGVLITNPDMLHSGVLPHHPRWARFFANLRFVVIDELHTYRGVFGSHLANVLRRLLRVARFHGAEPRLLYSSATIGNPAAHAERVGGRPAALVDESGAPAGERRLFVYNPPIVNAELGLRESCLKASVRLAADLVRARVPTMLFGQSRNQVEVMLKYLRDLLADERLEPGAIEAYRSGYLPETRRRIEEGLREGRVRCVAATSALELGVDIGSLDAVVCAGYPGSMAATWQRFGRGGRRNGASLALLVTSSAPLDQYLAGRPRMLVEAPVEVARADPDNVEILLQHLKCAAFELPFEDGDAFGDVPAPAVDDAMRFLASHRVVQPVPGRSGRTVHHWSGDAYPANAVSLRSASWDNFVVIERPMMRTIAEMDYRSTHTMLHEQAIYQHEGEQYQVEELDHANHKAFVRRVEPDYFTTAMTHVRVAVLAVEGEAPLSRGVTAGVGEVEVVEKVVGYKKIKFHTHENVGYGEVNLPELVKPTTSFWVTVPEALIASVDAPRAVVMDALAGLLSAMHAVAAVGLMMDPRDLGRALVDERGVGGVAPAPAADGRFEPTLHLYDAAAGGSGLAPRLHEERAALLERALSLVATCGCEAGCPSCIGPGAGVAGAAGAWSRKGVLLELLGQPG